MLGADACKATRGTSMTLALRTMKKTLIVCLAISVLLNVGLAAGWLNTTLIGCAETPSERLGVLTRDVEVGRFGESSALFTLPKGLVVRKASASGMGWFEPFRFRLVVTTNDESLVAYSDGELRPDADAEYYSADVVLRAAGETDVDEER